MRRVSKENNVRSTASAPEETLPARWGNGAPYRLLTPARAPLCCCCWALARPRRESARCVPSPPGRAPAPVSTTRRPGRRSRWGRDALPRRLRSGDARQRLTADTVIPATCAI